MRSLLGKRVAAASAAVVLLASCATGSEDAASTGDGDGGEPTEGADTSVVFGLDRGPYSMDPYRAALGGAFMAYLDPVYDTLIRMENDGTFSAGFAEEWEYLSPSEFQLSLRDGITFADGTPLDAAAVQANLDRLDTLVGPMTSELAPMYDRTEIVDDRTAVVHLSSPNPDLERIFSQVLGMMVNPSTLEQDEESLASTPDGAGPYVLDQARTVADDTYVYTRAGDYWDDESFPFDELTIRVYTDRNAMLSALQSGVATVGYGAPDNVAAAEGFGLAAVRLPVNVMLMNLSNRDDPDSPLADVRVRRAINLAIDRDAILENVYLGEGVATNQLFHDGIATGFDPELEESFPYDPDEARSLLAEAGFADGVQIDTGVPVATRDTVLAEAVASYLAEVGIELEIVPLPPGAFGADAWRPFDSITGSFASQGAFADTQLIATPSGSGWNPHDSVDETITSLWEQGAGAASAEERQSYFAELSAEFQEQAWFVPITRLNAVALYDDESVGNVEMPPGISTPRIRGWTVPTS